MTAFWVLGSLAVGAFLRAMYYSDDRPAVLVAATVYSASLACALVLGSIFLLKGVDKFFGYWGLYALSWLSISVYGVIALWFVYLSVSKLAKTSYQDMYDSTFGSERGPILLFVGSLTYKPVLLIFFFSLSLLADGLTQGGYILRHADGSETLYHVGGMGELFEDFIGVLAFGAWAFLDAITFDAFSTFVEPELSQIEKYAVSGLLRDTGFVRAMTFSLKVVIDLTYISLLIEAFRKFRQPRL